MVDFFEKVKDQAKNVAEKAQDKAQVAGKAGKEKLAEMQARRRADALLRDLGVMSYTQETGASTADSEEFARIVAELKELEVDGAVDTNLKTSKDDEKIDPNGDFGLDDV